MNRYEIVEFEPGDPEPAGLKSVTDRAGDEWARSGNEWVYGLELLSWAELMDRYGPLRAPATEFDAVRSELERAIKEAEEELNRLRAMLSPNRPGRTFDVGDSLPNEHGLTLKDRDGDFWRYDDDEGWGFKTRDGGTFTYGGTYPASFPLRYAPLTEVLSE